MKKLKKLTEQRKTAHATLLAMKSKVYGKFIEMEQVTYVDGHLPKGTKELIAVGISVAINCESCMQWHIEQAAKDGYSQEQILEAVEVGIEMAGGPGTAAARFALEAMEDVLGR